MPGWITAAEASFVPLKAAVFCCQCELISDTNSPFCLGCGSQAIVNLSRLLGGSLLGQNTTRRVTDAELNQLARDLVATAPAPRNWEPAFHPAAQTLPPQTVPALVGMANHSAGGASHMLLARRDLDLAELDLEPTISLIAERAQEVTAATGAAIALRKGREIVCRARAGRTAPDLGVRLQTDSGLSAECVRRGKVLLCNDAENHPQVDLAACRRLGARSVLVAPLRYFRRTLGLFEVLSSSPHAFDQNDASALQTLAGTMVAAISHRAGEESSRRSA